MILTNSEIKKQVEKGDIHINPFSERNLNPNSYNYHLGDKILEATNNIIDSKEKVIFKEITLNEQGYMLFPQKLYLANTLEEIGSDIFVTSLIGRSSVGRLGIFLQITADLGQLGAKHCWTLELKVVQPVKVYPGMKIGQVSFWQALGFQSKKYFGKYGSYSDPHGSEIFNEF
ncbi:MAG TPA: hypothetical protein VLG12_06530 [Candidatus Saccharimonadales bacterium]|nr:hypothetical protein [Candidatus Saccharimonadales bacterium]